MDPEPAEPLHVTCLCADWCGACRSWLPVLREIARSRPGVHFSWIDIEDEADVVGDLDIETFPTILVTRGGVPCFFGPVEPSRSQLERLVDDLLSGSGARAGASDPAVTALALRLHPLLAAAAL